MTADLILTNTKMIKILKTVLFLQNLSMWKNFMITWWIFGF